MAQRPTLTTEAGAPVIDNQNSQTSGASGPVLLQDHYLIEKLARFNRERIPERVVHAVGSGAHGYLEVTSKDVPLWTRMKVFSAAGKRTPVFIRFSTVAGSRGAVIVSIQYLALSDRRCLSCGRTRLPFASSSTPSPSPTREGFARQHSSAMCRSRP